MHAGADESNENDKAARNRPGQPCRSCGLAITVGDRVFALGVHHELGAVARGGLGPALAPIGEVARDHVHELVLEAAGKAVSRVVAR